MINKPKIRLFACISAILANASIAQAVDIYVAPNGNDNNAGTQSAPLETLDGARIKVRTLSKNQSIRVLFKAGTYRFENLVNFSAADSGTASNPIVYQSAPGETAFFDGGRSIDVSQFARVTGTLANRLPASARSSVWSQVITDNTTKALLSQSQNGLTYNNQLFRPTRSPNVGYYNIMREFSSGAFQIHESTDFTLLQNEQNRTGSGEVFGYVRREFAPYTIPINRFTGGGSTVIELQNGGFPGAKNDLSGGPRVRIRNLLPTLDEAREWFYDQTDSRLYIFPAGGNISSTDTLVVWGGNGAIKANGTNQVYFHNIVFQNFATVDPVASRFDSVVSFDSGTNMRLRGCTLRNIGLPLTPFNVLSRARGTIIDSCDIYDTARGSRLSGGGIITGSVQVGGNSVSNCHFTRVDSRYPGDAISIRGAGNRFTKNLVHNAAKQPIVLEGNDHTFDLNEIYNVCQEEGDGGAVYIGASLFSHGNEFNRNLIHHNITIPGLIPRAGIYFDDFDAGNSAVENILYKGGAYAIYSNKGTANFAQRNIVMKSFSGIRSGGGGTSIYNRCMQYLNRDGSRVPDQEIKENYIGRMLKTCGKSGWQSRVNSNNWRNEIEAFWTNRYPAFEASMDSYSQQQTMIPFETRFYDNHFAECTQNVQAPPGSDARNNNNFNLSAMVDAEGALDFRWRSGQRPAGTVNTNAFDPGLETGTFRPSMPSRSDYRSKVSQKFAAIPSYTDGASYNRNLANRNLYNSGRDSIAASQSGLNVREADAFKNSTTAPPPPPPASQSPFGGSTRSLNGSKTLQVEDYDNGGQSVAYSDVDPENRGGQGRTNEGVDTTNAADTGGGLCIGWTQNNEWTEYTVNIDAGTYDIELRTAAQPANPGGLRLSLNNTNLGTVDVTNSGGWQTWKTDTLNNVTVPAANNGILRLTIVDGANFNINWIKFVPVSSGGGGNPPPGATSLTGVDIGNTSPAGSTQNTASGSYTISGAGADIWNAADAFHFASDPVTGSTGTAIARVASVANTNTWAKAGLHYRDSNAAGAKNVGVYVRPDGQVAMQWRSSTSGGSSWHGSLLGGTGFAKWVRLTKNGDSYTGAWSSNGANWTDIRTVSVSMGNDNLVGLAVTSHNNGTLCAADFTNFSHDWATSSGGNTGGGSTGGGDTGGGSTGGGDTGGGSTGGGDTGGGSTGGGDTGGGSTGGGDTGGGSTGGGDTGGGSTGGTPQTVNVIPSDDAYLRDGTRRYNSSSLRIDASSRQRTTYLKFDVTGVNGTVTGAKLIMQVSDDAGSGTISVHQGSGNGWTEGNLSSSNAPDKGALLGTKTGTFSKGSTQEISLDGITGNGVITLIVSLNSGGNDVKFHSTEGATAPKLEVTSQ